MTYDVMAASRVVSNSTGVADSSAYKPGVRLLPLAAIIHPHTFPLSEAGTPDSRASLRIFFGIAVPGGIGVLMALNYQGQPTPPLDGLLVTTRIVLTHLCSAAR